MKPKASETGPVVDGVATEPVDGPFCGVLGGVEYTDREAFERAYDALPEDQKAAYAVTREGTPTEPWVLTREPASTDAPDAPPRPKRRCGFACLTPAQRKAVAAQGGRASHAQKRGHQWTSAEAREAGRKGGKVSRGGRGRAKPDGAS